MKKRLIIASVLILSGVGGVAALNAPSSSGADTSPLTTEVDRQGQQLSNHEARITNTENDVKDLQDKTGTAPSTTRVEVPISSTTPTVTSTPSPSAAPAITVVSSGIIVGDQHDGYCYLTYSDGSTDYAKATLTTVVNGNSSATSDNCQSFIGKVK